VARDWRPAAVWSGRGSFLSEVCCVCSLFWFVRGAVVLSGGVAGASGAGSSGGVASVVPGSFVLAGGGAFAAGLPAGVRSSGALARVARSWGPCVGLLRRAVPLFFGASLTSAARPCLRALVAPAGEARPLRRDQPRGVFKRQRRLAKRGYANDQGLNQTSGIRQRVSAALLMIRHGANPLRSL